MPFRGIPTIGGPVDSAEYRSRMKVQALKVLEEAAELVEASKDYIHELDNPYAAVEDMVACREAVLDERADVQMALENFDAMMDFTDTEAQLAVKACDARNHARGRF